MRKEELKPGWLYKLAILDSHGKAVEGVFVYMGENGFGQFYPPGKSFLSETFGIEPHNVVAEIGQYL